MHSWSIFGRYMDPRARFIGKRPSMKWIDLIPTVLNSSVLVTIVVLGILFNLTPSKSFSGFHWRYPSVGQKSTWVTFMVCRNSRGEETISERMQDAPLTTELPLFSIFGFASNNCSIARDEKLLWHLDPQQSSLLPWCWSTSTKVLLRDNGTDCFDVGKILVRGKQYDQHDWSSAWRWLRSGWSRLKLDFAWCREWWQRTIQTHSHSPSQPPLCSSR